MATLAELQELDEDDFTHEVIKPLFKEMNYKGVRVTHGQKEYGKDLIFYQLGPFDNKRWGAAQLKVRDVHGGLTKKGNYQEVKNQIESAFGMSHPVMESTDYVPITEVYLITSKEIKENAKEVLIDEFSDKPVFFVDGESVLEKVEEYDIPITEEEKFERSVKKTIEEEELPVTRVINGEEVEIGYAEKDKEGN